MNVWGCLAAGLAGWIVVACLGGAVWSFAVTRLKRRRPAVGRVARPAAYPPAVPAPSRHSTDMEWLQRQLTRRDVDLRLRDIEAAEGWAAR